MPVRTFSLAREYGWIFAILPVVIWASRVDGAISDYSLGKRIYYRQTNDLAPTNPVSIDGGPTLNVTDPADFTMARVFSTNPSLLSPISPIDLMKFSDSFWGAGKGYASVAEMDIDLPPGDVFGYLVEGGSLGSRLGLLQIPATNHFATSIPQFTGNAFTQLNGVNPAAPITITWNNFTPQPEINEAPIFFSVYRVADGQVVFNMALGTSATSSTIPANTLTAATQYDVELYLSSRIHRVDVGFISADTFVAYDQVTRLQFTSGSGIPSASVPELASMTLVAGVLMTLLAARGRNRLPAAIFVILTATGPAALAVDFYRVGKTSVHRQTSDSAPTTPSVVYGGVDIFTQMPSEFTSTRVFSTKTTPPSPVPEFVLTQFSPGYWGSSQGYPSLMEIDAALPPGDTFGFLIEGGDLGERLALMFLSPANLFSTNIPFYTGNAFSRLNDMDATEPFTATWNSFGAAPGINDALIYFNITRVSDGQLVVGTSLPMSATSYVIPANTLAPNTLYRATLDFSSRANTIDAGFNGADASLLYDSVTEIEFTTNAPLPGDYNRNGTVDAADYLIWRKSFGQTEVVPFSGADGDGDGQILAADYGIWRANFGKTQSDNAALAFAVPETNGAMLAMAAICVIAVGRIKK